jgi:hypothetical protein
MKGKYFSFKFIILAIILFTCLSLFSFPSLALIPGDFGSAGGGPPDGCVNFEDLMIFAMAYGSTPGDANWNEACDIASEGGALQPDGVIDFEDLMIFAMHYGEFLVHNLTKDAYYNTIQAALDNADNNNTIEVSDGTYDESIVFPSGKKVILQSVNGASLTIIRGNDGLNTVTLNNSSEGTTLEGFIITHTNGLTGRGIFIYNGNLTINNCTISGNSADWGSGIGICNNSTVTIIGSTIFGNSAGSGGGIYNYTNSTVTIIGSTIFGDSAGDSGGGIANCDNSTITIIGSTISGNSTYIHGGGGIFNYAYSTLTITGSTISGNYAGDDGGGISNCDNSTITITGSTISSNSAEYNGGGIYIGPNSGILSIGGDSANKKNTICGNYKTGEDPSLDQQIRDAYGDIYETYKDTNYISAYCE